MVQALGDCSGIIRVFAGRPAGTPGSPGDGRRGLSVAVVLGAQVLPGGRPSGTLRARTLHAAGMYFSGEVKRLVVTGGLGEHPPSEAEVMAGILHAAGVPAEAVIEEREARTTWESARHVSRMMKSRRISEAYIVTDPLHCVRTAAAFGECGLRTRPEPVYGSPSWRVNRLRREQFVREMGASFWYRIRHGVGSRTRR